MNLNQVQSKVNSIVKVVFKEHDKRTPMIGKFVNLKDSKDLSRKEMIRFVNQSRFDFWNDEEPSVALTRIYCVSDFSQVIDIR